MSCRYFENRDCEFYPCHDLSSVNCLFCFCPLYFTDCGGNFLMLEGENKQAIKDCSKCCIPHTPEGYDYIMERLRTTPIETQRQYYGEEWL